MFCYFVCTYLSLLQLSLELENPLGQETLMQHFSDAVEDDIPVSLCFLYVYARDGDFQKTSYGKLRCAENCLLSVLNFPVSRK